MLSEDKGSIHKAARDFTLNEVVHDFGLEHSYGLVDGATYRWKIETLPEVKTFQPSASLGKVSPYVIEPCNDKGPSIAPGQLYRNIRPIK